MKERDENDIMERLSSIWGDLQQTNRFPWNGQLMSTCEAELQELMKQIDIMVQNKKVEWERELQASDAKLQLKDRECTMQKATVEQKAREINQLRQQVESMERNHRQSGGEYERNLEKVKTDFDFLKRDYEKLQKKLSRHTKEVAKEKTKTSTELQGTHAEMQRAQSRLEDYRQRSKDWDLEKRNLEKQIESLESQRRTLQEKCDLIEQQATGYQSQLDKRRQILDNTEYNLKTQITQLEGQVERAQDTIAAQDSQLSKMKMTLDETVSIQRRLLDEKEYAERELRDSKKHAVSLEDELSHLRLEYKKQEEYLRIAQSSQQNSRDQIQELERTLHNRQELKEHGDVSKEKDAEIKKLTEDLRQAKTEIKQYKKTEKRSSEELSRQRSQIKQAEVDVDKLRIKFQEKMGGVKGSESKKSKELQAEISKLKQTLATQSESSEVQVSDLKRKVASLKEELQERALAVNSMNDHFNMMQSQHRLAEDKFEQRAAEIQVANAQLEALRLENRHLRQTAMKQIQTNADVMEAESHLKELQNAYTASLSRIEGENKNLQHQLNLLQSRIREIEGECAEKERLARSAAQRSIQELQSMEERRIQDVQTDYEKRLNNLQLKMERKLRDAQMELDQTLHEKSAIEQELSRRTDYMKRAYTENEVMSHFVEGVSEIISQPPSEDARTRMVTPRLVGALDEPFAAGHFDSPLNFPESRMTRTSTKVHFNESELPNHSLLAQNSTNTDSVGQVKSPNQSAENRSSSADKGTQSGARPKNKPTDSYSAFQSDEFSARKSPQQNERVSPKQGQVENRHIMSPMDARIQSPLCGRDIGSPSKPPSPGQGPLIGGRVPSPMGRAPSPLRVPSPMRIPSPSHAFQRISPNQRSDQESVRSPDRLQARSASTIVDQRGGRGQQYQDSHNRPGSAPGANTGAGVAGVAGNTSAGTGTGAVGGIFDVSAMVNLSLSDTSDSERPASRASLATRFYEEEQERAKELEKLIDSHIEDLKLETEKTIRKYTR